MDLRELIDRAMIERLLSRYAQWVDAADVELAEDLTKLFTDDACHDESIVGFGPFNGEREIREAFKSAIPKMSSMHHCTSNVLISFENADNAAAVSSLLYEGMTREGVEVRIKGLFTDKLRRCADNEWRFALRRLSLSAPLETTQARA